MNPVHLVVPAGVDDPGRPSGGNLYDRRAADELTALGWSVRMHAVSGSWPTPDPADLTGLVEAVRRIPDRATVVVDGLIGSCAPQALVPEADRLRLVVLVHMPLSEQPGDLPPADVAAREREVLAAAAAVLTTSNWTRDRLLERYLLPPDRVHVAEPGVDPAALAPGTASGGELVCVAAVTHLKGHDLLLSALAKLEHLRWRCTCVGAVDRDPDFVERLREQARSAGLDARVRFAGPLTGAALDRAYAAADVLVLPSRAETYGMVVTEALARGLPVIATDVGGVREAVGPNDARESSPALLVRAEQPGALADALAAWLGDVGLRRRLREAAQRRRATLIDWSVTGHVIARVLEELA